MTHSGALAFYGKSTGDISHVAICLNDDGSLVIEAGGGDSRTRTRLDAAAQNAYVRVRPTQARFDLVAIVSPEEIRSSPPIQQLMRRYMLAMIGIPYRWGGDDMLDGFDCSGFAIEVYRAFGVWSGGDMTAQSLYAHFSNLNGSIRL